MWGLCVQCSAEPLVEVKCHKVRHAAAAAVAVSMMPWQRHTTRKVQKVAVWVLKTTGSWRAFLWGQCLSNSKMK